MILVVSPYRYFTSPYRYKTKIVVLCMFVYMKARVCFNILYNVYQLQNTTCRHG